MARIAYTARAATPITISAAPIPRRPITRLGAATWRRIVLDRLEPRERILASRADQERARPTGQISASAAVIAGAITASGVPWMILFGDGTTVTSTPARSARSPATK